ncbi:MAG: GNAT family N-acetyltransferase [Rhodospirillales bacterium 20-64-7]|nr:MAG: GNAT family N-acetyltransferase [Rhodospirillales bacterium 20-64-7]
MSPVGGGDLQDLVALKADPQAFAQMLGGVRSAQRTAEELAEEIRAWGEFGFGMWAVRVRGGHKLLGVTGLMHRPDGRGIALRFAFWPAARGVGLATEAVHAALVYAHDTVGLEKIVAVAREDNFASRIVLGAIGMWEAERFNRDGVTLLVYNSVRHRNAG